jgi:hypothetical protein
MGRQSYMGKIVEQLCKDYPNTPTMTLAKKLYAEHKEHFLKLEGARNLVRAYRGELIG